MKKEKVDAYRCQIKDEKLQRVRNSTIYMVIGVDLDKNKNFLVITACGHENKGIWL